MARRRKSAAPVEPTYGVFNVESLDLDAQGIAHDDEGKVVFIEGALPGERVKAQITRVKAAFSKARTVEVLKSSAMRVVPQCRYFGLCGGCSMQHLEPSAQVAIKQRTLEDNLWHIGRVKPQTMLRPMHGTPWHYRFRGRLSVKFVPKKGGALVGFHERGTAYVADMISCEILPKAVSDLLVPLRALIGAMSAPDRMPQIELAMGETDGAIVLALLLRHLDPLPETDLQLLRDFALEHAAIGVEWHLQSKGPDTVHTLDNAPSRLAYSLPEFGVTMPFKPTDFTQVNHRVNRVLVDRAVRLLALEPQHRVIDWFCGLGNFTLPLATAAAQVLGIEGSATLVQRARDNAALNGLSSNTQFEACNLFEVSALDVTRWGAADRWLIDPPREGAHALVKAVAELHLQGSDVLPQRIVYISCNPATLGRDADVLVHEAGYTLQSAGVVNMFPHTSHVESMAVFERLG